MSASASASANASKSARALLRKFAAVAALSREPTLTLCANSARPSVLQALRRTFANVIPGGGFGFARPFTAVPYAHDGAFLLKAVMFALCCPSWVLEFAVFPLRVLRYLYVFRTIESLIGFVHDVVVASTLAWTVTAEFDRAGISPRFTFFVGFVATIFVQRMVGRLSWRAAKQWFVVCASIHFAALYLIARPDRADRVTGAMILATNPVVVCTFLLGWSRSMLDELGITTPAAVAALDHALDLDLDDDDDKDDALVDDLRVNTRARRAAFAVAFTTIARNVVLLRRSPWWWYAHNNMRVVVVYYFARIRDEAQWASEISPQARPGPGPGPGPGPVPGPGFEHAEGV